MSGQIVINHDLGKMTSILAMQTVQKTATFTRRYARVIVRKRSRMLENSIRSNKTGKYSYETIAGGSAVPYALAQEYGRPDIPNYGYTPYMRPSALISEKSPETRSNIMKATIDAIKGSKVNLKKDF